MGVRAISFAGAEGNRFAYCFNFGGVGCEKDGAIAQPVNSSYDTTRGTIPQWANQRKLEKLVEQFLNKPPEVRFEDVRYLLEAFGFEEKRSKGSHHSFRDSQGRKITVPKKGGQKVKGIYVQQIVELLNLEEWSDEDTESEEQAD